MNNISFSTWPSKDFVGSLQEGCNGLLLNSQEFVALAEKRNGNFNGIITYKVLDGKEYKSTTEEIIIHCMNHSTYHRGQLITMLHQSGFKDVGSTDYIRFCREKG